MKLSIDTKVLSKYNLTLGEFLTLMFPYLQINPALPYWNLIAKKLADEDLTGKNSLVLSDNTKDLISRVLVESDSKLSQSPIKDYELLAQKLMEIYPLGCKEGTSYKWRGTTAEIAQKLRILVALHNFTFTEEEALEATKQYVSQFPENKKHMKLLKYFILKVTPTKDIHSDFMTLIENNRDETNSR